MKTARTNYDTDFYAWTQGQASALRSGEALDIENLAEELESLGRSERREVVSRIRVLLTHLLKWEYQPELRCRSWATTIRNQRRDIEEVLRESPSLRPWAKVDALRAAYPGALADASDEMRLLRPLTLETLKVWYSLEAALTNDIEL